jgi:transposase-like protein
VRSETGRRPRRSTSPRRSVRRRARHAAPDRNATDVIPDTNAIESLNARYRRAIKARGHFPSEQAALKCLYLVTRSLDPTGKGRARWAMRWKPALDAFSITFRRPVPGRRDLLTNNAGNTLSEIVPAR